MMNEMNFSELLGELKAENPEKAGFYESAEVVANIIAEFHTQRVKLGYSQRDIERLTGIKQPMIARIEKGDVIPRLDTLARLAESVRMTVQLSEKPMITTAWKQSQRRWKRYPVGNVNVCYPGGCAI